MHLLGSPDGIYQWMNGDSSCNIKKEGHRLTLHNSDTIAGSSVTLLESVNNLLQWSKSSIPSVLLTVTAGPASMLGLHGIKGTLDVGADADFVILSERETTEGKALVIDEVWKFGKRMYQKAHNSSGNDI
ncbi:carbohydrate esterase family 9 [Cordyceps fumosorosea ARSEF 2679]|uniref:Carbohydrate esterase family 9 n=1 Tax=Cordyceps fumosorosea (strain ARSEF 2679) TaxID=1081104 RepID=A0A167CIT5_CORFA|nr:carbohydrate esterase family 9 [Cordyceps fumosorosea ARSEF 2679]OAA41246.1 carbohydrate esterase family 9 [Cordyceps fumosorosea ARSEF 2679]